MRQCARHGTAVAVAAGLHLSVGLVVLWCFAEQESGKIEGNRHLSASLGACQQQGVGDAVVRIKFAQMSDNGSLGNGEHIRGKDWEVAVRRWGIQPLF